MVEARLHEEVAGIIRLARKYQADDLRMHCIEIFKTAWPVTLEEWDAREREVVRLWNELLPFDSADYDGDNTLQRYLPDPGRMSYCPPLFVNSSRLEYGNCNPARTRREHPRCLTFSVLRA
jgi:hypothetical protein